MTDRPPRVASLQVKTDGQAPSTHFDASEPLNLSRSHLAGTEAEIQYKIYKNNLSPYWILRTHRQKKKGCQNSIRIFVANILSLPQTVKPFLSNNYGIEL